MEEIYPWGSRPDLTGFSLFQTIGNVSVVLRDHESGRKISIYKLPIPMGLKARIRHNLTGTYISQTFRIKTAMTNPPKRHKTSSTSLLPDSINGFTLLPIKLPSPLTSVPSAIHILYVRRHEETPRPPSITSPESSRTVFVVNIPVDSTKETLRGLFASLGARLEDVRFHGQDDDDVNEDPEKLVFPDIWDKRLHTGGETAHITFPTTEDITKILKTISTERKTQPGPIREWGTGVENPTSSLGIQRKSPVRSPD